MKHEKSVISENLNNISFDKAQIKNKKYLSNNELFYKEIEKYDNFELIYLLLLCKNCEKYEEIIYVFDLFYKKYPNNFIEIEIISILEIAFKKLISQKQKQINKLYDLLEYSKNEQEEVENNLISNLNKFKNKIIKEIFDLCNKIIDLIDKFILKNITDIETGINREIEVFLYKLKGDSNKYMSQFNDDEEIKKSYLKEAKKFYTNSINICNKYLPITNKTLLNCYLSYCKFLTFFKNENGESQNLISYILNNKEIKNLENEDQKLIEIELIKELKDLDNYIINNTKNK